MHALIALLLSCSPTPGLMDAQTAYLEKVFFWVAVIQEYRKTPIADPPSEAAPTQETHDLDPEDDTQLQEDKKPVPNTENSQDDDDNVDL